MPAPEPTPPPPPPMPAAPNEATLRTDSFRVELMTERGVAVLPDYPIYPGDRNNAGWVRIGFPLADFNGAIGDKLQRILILTHGADTVYIGEIKLRLDTSTIQARPMVQPAITQVGQPVTFLANATAGLTPLKVEWDFGAAAGGQPQLATGDRVVNVFEQPGSYEVMMTVRDATGANPEPRTYALLVQVK
jgi:hypothetical protein